jgi:predicted metal-dependent HD superfamily phosphohydrolase
VVSPGVAGLRERFGTLIRRLGGSGDPAPPAHALLEAWAAPARRYHGTSHLLDCLARLDESPARGVERDLVEAALWFHDAVYDPLADDNEERSAGWARRALEALGVPPGTIGEVSRLILLTRHTAPPVDSAGRLLCDIDLSILGRDAAEFDQYDRLIRAEYAALPEAAYREGRRRVLAELQTRRPLYGTVWFRERFEALARDNLQRALKRLGSRAQTPDG